MTPIDRYQERCRQDNLTIDSQQLIILNRLQAIYFQLRQENNKRQSLLSGLLRSKLITGLYLAGSVGSGKTLLMDCFYQALPFANKKRYHFHDFMRMVHTQLKKIQGHKNPLAYIAKAIAKSTLVLCFDEMVVNDIVDAMLLGQLFKHLYLNKVCVIVTSNTVPDELYKNGLQRELFLPAIALLKLYSPVMTLNSEYDYRLRHLDHAGVFFTPNDQTADANMLALFTLLAEHSQISYDPIIIYDRPIAIKQRTAHIIWFEFADICHKPRSAADYLALSQEFSTIFISNISRIAAHENNTVTLFIKLIDILYDKHVRLVVSSACAVDDLYAEGPMTAAYLRAASRLHEMQTEMYFAKRV